MYVTKVSVRCRSYRSDRIGLQYLDRQRVGNHIHQTHLSVGQLEIRNIVTHPYDAIQIHGGDGVLDDVTEAFSIEEFGIDNFIKHFLDLRSRDGLDIGFATD